MSEAEQILEQASPGQALAAARAGLNLSVADVSQQIKYGVKQIAAIEADDYAKLPGTTIVRGMIRSYAKLVRLDPLPLLANLGRHDIPAPVTVDLHTIEHEPFLEGERKSNRVYVYLSLAALMAVAIVAYEWSASPPPTDVVATIKPKFSDSEAIQAPRSPASAPEKPVGTEASDPVAAPALALAAVPAVVARRMPEGSKRLELEFGDVSWAEIKQANGKILLSQLNPAGSRQSIEGVPPFEVVIGNAANVRLKYNDAPVDLRPHFKVDVARLKLE